MVGGGLVPKPGEVSLAHRGVLFLDELPEFRKDVLEGLRQPLEDGEVTIVRSSMCVTYPSAFMLVAAMNPCEDSLAGPAALGMECTDFQRLQYYSRLSRPLLDRIDIQIEVPRVEFRDMIEARMGETSADIRARVFTAREIQLQRFQGTRVLYNSRMQNPEVRKFLQLSDPVKELLQAAVDRLGLSARAFHRVLKVARTIADLAGAEELDAGHVGEAIQYRVPDKLS
jgi:magnesium chelatase family protein